MNKNTELIKKLFNTPFPKSIECYDKIHTEDIVLHGPMTGQEEYGLVRLKEVDGELSRNYKNVRREIHEIFAIEDKVVVYWTVQATSDEGANKGKEILISGHGIYRFRGEKICEIWQSWDRINFLDQLHSLERDLREAQQNPGSSFLNMLGTEVYFRKASLLSSREKECLKLLLQGKTAKETAQILTISYRTVEFYFENIKNKLGGANKRELSAMARVFEKLALL